MYGDAEPPLFTDRCTARENGVASTQNKAVAATAPSKPPFHPFLLGCRPAVAGFFAKVGRLRDLRVLAADESQGLVLLSMVTDHAGDAATVTLDGTVIPVPAPFLVPNSHYRAVLLKVRDGRIEHIEAITRPVFLGLDDGWDD